MECAPARRGDRAETDIRPVGGCGGVISPHCRDGYINHVWWCHHIFFSPLGKREIDWGGLIAQRDAWEEKRQQGRGEGGLSQQFVLSCASQWRRGWVFIVDCKWARPLSLSDCNKWTSIITLLLLKLRGTTETGAKLTHQSSTFFENALFSIGEEKSCTCCYLNCPEGRENHSTNRMII